MASRHTALHWEWPFEAEYWTEDKDLQIVPEHEVIDDLPVVTFENAAELAANLELSARQRVNAPISGKIKSVERNGTKAHVQIETLLDDGTRIYNTFKYLEEAPAKLVEGYMVGQGEWIGWSGEGGFYADVPYWYCWAALPGQAGKYVYADDFAEDFCNGIDWKGTTTIPEIYDPFEKTAPAPMPGMSSNKGLMLLGAAALAFLVLGKKR